MCASVEKREINIFVAVLGQQRELNHENHMVLLTNIPFIGVIIRATNKFKLRCEKLGKIRGK